MKMKTKSYYKIGIIAAVITAGIAALLTYIVIENSLETIKVPVANPTTGVIRKGDIILAEDISLVEVGAFNFPGNIVKDPKVVKDTYATRDMYPGEYFYKHSILTSYPKSLAEKVRYGALAVPIDLITSVNADIEEDDFVMVKIIMGADSSGETTDEFSNVDVAGRLPDPGVTIIDDELLSAVRVVGFYESGGADITRKKRFNRERAEKEESLNPRMIVFDANPIQQALLLQGTHGGKIQLIILPEEEQIKHKMAWGLLDHEGQVIESPIFEDDTKEIEKIGEELKSQSKQEEENQDNLDELIRQAAKEHLPNCEDPFTCKDPIHYNHVCTEDPCTDPIHHLIECEDENCTDPAHNEAITID